MQFEAVRSEFKAVFDASLYLDVMSLMCCEFCPKCASEMDCSRYTFHEQLFFVQT